MMEWDNYSPILITKLQKPNLPEDLIHRKKLVDYVNENISRPLTLVSAGAGFGKSTFVSNWINAIPYKSCWFSIDENDNDIRIFLSYLIAAIQTQIPAFGENIYRNIYSPNIGSLEILTNNLINDLNSLQEDILLVLDDFQNITNIEITNLISNILKYPLGKFHLVIISRIDPPLPLAKLRASNKMKDIRSSHLRLSNDEIKLFIQNSFNNQDIDSITEIFNSKFEGWVTGIRLLKIHFSYVDNSLNEIERFVNENHLSETYFIEEIIRQIDKDTLKFLLQTSVLQKFNNELSNFVISENNMAFNSKSIIKGLLNKNLFLINLDNNSEWFRYHHLFQDTLQEELKRQCDSRSIINIHKKAVVWFSSNGMFDEAFYHAAKTNDTDIIVDFVKENMYMPLNANKWFVLEKWLKHIPDEVINNNPKLLIANMWVMQHKGVFLVIPELIEKIEELKDNNIELYEEIKPQLVFFKAVINFWTGNIRESAGQFDYVRNKITSDKIGAISLSSIYYATALQMLGNGDEAYKEIQLTISKGNINPDYKVILLGSLIFIKLLKGDLYAAERITKQFGETTESLNNNFYVAWYNFFMGYISFQQYRLRDALMYFKNSMKFVYLLNIQAPIDTFAGLLLTLKIIQNKNEYEQIYNKLTSFTHEWNNPSYNTTAFSLKTRLAIIENNPQKAVENFKKTDMLFDTGVLVFNIETPRITLCKFLIYQGKTGEAINKLTEILNFLKKINNIPLIIETLIILSTAYVKENKDEAAIDKLTEAVNLAEAGHIIYPFIEAKEEIKALLLKIKSADKNTQEFISLLTEKIPDINEILSDDKLSNRELDIVNLLAQRLSNQEIADKLFISVSTVKRHTINIYQKLDVNKRREAVKKAVELGLIKSYSFIK